MRSLPDTARCMLVKRPDHSAVVRLDLSGLEDLIPVLSGTERSVRLLDGLRAELGDDPQDWLAPFIAAMEGARR